MDDQHFRPPLLKQENEKKPLGNIDSDVVLIIILVWMFCSRLIFSLLVMLRSDFFTTSIFLIFNASMQIISGFIPLGLSFIIQDSSKRTIMIVFSIIYLIINVGGAGYQLFETVLRDLL